MKSQHPEREEADTIARKTTTTEKVALTICPGKPQVGKTTAKSNLHFTDIKRSRSRRARWSVGETGRVVYDDAAKLVHITWSKLSPTGKTSVTRHVRR